METILSVKNLTVEFGEHKIINDLSFEIKRDEIIAIVGPNGAGKSVLFRSLLGTVDYKGEIRWAEGVRFGYVPQKLSVDRDVPLSVSEFLGFKETDKEKINKMLSQVGFKTKAEHLHHDTRVLKERLGNLSGGELQRILFAYALMGNPNVLLLDEPMAGVDITGEETFYSLFKKLKAEKDLTILFISHDPEIVKGYADRVIALKHEH